VGFTLAFFVTLVTVLLASGKTPLPHLTAVLGAALAGTLLGATDDLRPMRSLHKFMGQEAIGVFLFLTGIRLEAMHLPFLPEVTLPLWASAVLTALWVACVMNAVNLIDGMDGSAGGLTCIASIALFVLGVLQGNTTVMLLSAALAGAMLGFLRYNWYPASIFMGDSGSMFLGVTLATISLLATRGGTTTGSMWVPMAFVALPFVDTISSMARRLVHGYGLFTADKSHLHHQLLDSGLSQRQVAVVFYTIGILVSAVGVLCFRWREPYSTVVLAGLACLLLLVMYLLPRIRRRFLDRGTATSGSYPASPTDR